jgi:hypothetical protein
MMPAVRSKRASKNRGKAALAWECRVVCIEATKQITC